MNSEMARLVQDIELAYMAAQRALDAPAITAKHAFITTRMERIGRCYEKLCPIVGEREASALTVSAMERAATKRDLEQGVL